MASIMSEGDGQVADREARVVDGAFGGGYLIRGGTNTAPGLVTDWPAHVLGHLTYHPHPRTRLHTATDEDSLRRVVILGDPVDVAAGLSDGRRVCERVLQAWATDGINGAIRYLAYLGGRWTAVLDAVVAPGAAPEITVVPDCQASQAVFYSTVRGIALGSQPALVAETV